jgi:hypothetical protein
MKNLALVISILFVALTATSQDKIDTHIRGLMQEQMTCWNEGDLECFMKHYWKSDSLTFIGKSGVTNGWQATLDNYKKGYPDREAMGTLTFDILTVEPLSEDKCYVIGKWDLQRKDDAPGGHYTLLWKLIDGNWVIVSDHSS